MSIWVPIACSAVILMFSVSLLRASGVWTQIFAPRNLRPKDTFDPLVAAPYGWIENHVFWDNAENKKSGRSRYFNGFLERRIRKLCQLIATDPGSSVMWCPVPSGVAAIVI